MATERHHFSFKSLPHFGRPHIHGPHLRSVDVALLTTAAGALLFVSANLDKIKGSDRGTGNDDNGIKITAGLPSNIEPTQEPTLTPTLTPTLVPTEAPTPIPTATAKSEQTSIPTSVPTRAAVQAQPTVESTKAAAVDAAKIQREVWAKITNDAIAATNAERVKRGLSSLRVDNRLSIVAQKQIDLVVSRGYPFYYSDAHTGNDQTVRAKREGYPYEVLEVAGYAVLGLSNNIAADFVRSWVYDSPGHSAELLAPDNVTIGGYCASRDVKRSDGMVGVAICYLETGK